VLIVGVRFAVVTEVSIVANCTLVPDTLDVILLVLAKRPIAVNSDVASTVLARHRDGFVDGGKAVLLMNEGGILEALGAVVPIWAVEALVADTEDWL